MRFVEVNGSAAVPSRFWVAREGDSLTAYLSQPEQEPSAEVRYLKRHLLEKKDRPSRRRRRVRYRPGEALRAWLELVGAAAPPITEPGELWMLMPALAGEQHHQYLDLVRKASEAFLPDGQDAANYLLEPEMVLEYFRLYRQELKLKRGEIGLFLIVDSGAQTTNITVVASTTQGTITTAKERRGLLVPVGGQAVNHAGNWVDEQIAEELKADFPGVDQEVLLAVAERAKVQSSEGSDVEVDWNGTSAILPSELFADLADELWDKTEETLRKVLDDAVEQIRNQSRYQRIVEELELESGADLAPEFSCIVLAGGTSLLPGFENALMRRLLSISGHSVLDLKTLAVNERNYAQAAVVGAGLHILQRRGALKLAQTDEKNLAGRPALEEVRRDDIVLRFKSKPPTPPLTILERNREPGEWVMDAGQATREGKAALSWREAKRPNTSWAPYRFRTEADKRVGVSLDGDSRLKAHFLEADDPGLFMDLKKTAQYRGKVELARGSRMAAGATGDLVIDFGMSKTLMVTTADSWDGTLQPLNTTSLITPSPDGWTIGPETEGGTTSEKAKADDSPPSKEEVSSPAAPSSTPSPVVEELTLQAFWDRLDSLGFEADVVARLRFLHLALLVRPFAMLAGPPGWGKSTLARRYGACLGAREAPDFHRIQVQSHWVSDAPLFSEGHGQLKALLTDGREPAGHMRVVLLDEMNATRPEYYLGRTLGALDCDLSIEEQRVLWSSGSQSGVLFIGTLNIDEDSPPPADKTLDRGFVLEMPARSVDEAVREMDELPDLSCLSIISWAGWRAQLSELQFGDTPGRQLLGTFSSAISASGLDGRFRAIAPSRRAIMDVLRLEAVAATLAPEHSAAMLDKAFCGRILPFVRGPKAALNQTLEQLIEATKDMPDAQRHLKQMLETPDYVSFWG